MDDCHAAPREPRAALGMRVARRAASDPRMAGHLMSRATGANRLYVIAERNRGRDEFAPAEPAREGRALLAAALTRRRADELALDRLLPGDGLSREIDR